MLFNSSVFLTIFLPLTITIYTLSPKRFQNILLLVLSLFFYSWGGARFLPILLISVWIDFLLIGQISGTRNRTKRRALFGIALVANLLLLGYFKYANFFIESITSLIPSLSHQSLNIVLPIGISFFTFQKISYLADVFTGKAKKFESLLNYTLYILMFPQLIAGPIVRFREISEQILGKRNESIDFKIWGFYRFSIGLVKKVIIADLIAITVNEIFALDPGTFGILPAWVGILGYSMQIFFDFSGYSDMAIGIGAMLGYRFPENFNFPYIATSITSFWKRWHITLSNWFRQYVYIPLGGNRVSDFKVYRNIMVVFLLSGLWHGAAWTFVFWGALHGIMIVLERAFLIDLYNKFHRIPVILFNFFLVNIGWVFFRADNFGSAFEYLKSMFGLNGNNFYHIDTRYWVLMAIAIIFAFLPLVRDRFDNFARHFGTKLSNRQAVLMLLLAGILFLIGVATVHGNSHTTFIYFRF